MTTLDPAYCADGCGRLAETERPMGVSPKGEAFGYDDGEGYLHVELVCRQCAHTVAQPGITFDQDMGDL